MICDDKNIGVGVGTPAKRGWRLAERATLEK